MNFKTLLDKPGSTEQSNLAQDVGYMWRQCQFPVICSIHNLCFGGGMQIALGCDFRFASPDSKLSIMEAKWGLVPDMSISVTLRELMSIDKAKVRGEERRGEERRGEERRGEFLLSYLRHKSHLPMDDIA